MANRHNKGITILFLCQCGTNISNIVDLEAVKQWAKDQKGIHLIVTGNLLCSPREKDLFAKVITSKKLLKGQKIKSIVVAACSPKLHEKTFQDIAEEKGINISKVSMANIREQCAWVSTDGDEATKKAITLINAAVKRSEYTQDLLKQTMKVNPDVLIVGGGISGIKTALTLSKTERKIYIVEKEISIGGNVIKLEEVAPNMDCAPCLLSPLLAEIRDTPNIEVISNAEVTDIIGFFGNFSATIQKKARYVESSCIGCEECFDVCPVSVNHDFHLGLGERKAVYTLFAGSVPAEAVIDKINCKHFIDDTCEECKKVCPFQSINFDQQDEQIEVNIGSIVLATGLENPDNEIIAKLGFGTIDNVITTPHFERMFSSNGPTDTEVLLKNGKPPKSIAVIHCAGSMTDNGIPYCSGICCTNAIKIGEMMRHKNPEIVIYNIHNDLVFPDPKQYNFYMKQKEDGTLFKHCTDLASIEVTGKKGKITISGTSLTPLKVDMVILSTGLQPTDSMSQLASICDLDCNKQGYFITDHDLLHRTGSVLDGIYISGSAAGPCNVSSATIEAQAVSGDILSKLIKDKEIDLEVMTASIDADKCGGCKLCIVSCPFKAITFDSEKNISIINDAICRGCGTCTASCPSGASTAKHFTDEQIYAELGGLLDE